MQTSWRRYFEVGIVHCMLFPDTLQGEGPILPTLETIVHDPFFGAVEVGKILDPGVRQRVASLLAMSNMTVIYSGGASFFGHKCDLGSPDPSERRRSVEFCRDMIDEAYQFRAQALVIPSGPDAQPRDRASHRALLVESLRELRDYAAAAPEDYLLTLSLETFDRDVDKRQLIGPTTEAREVVETAAGNEPGLGLSLDLSHLPLLNEESGAAIAVAGEFLVHVHIGNCVNDCQHCAHGDQHPRFGIAGGANDVREVAAFLGQLLRSGYSERPTAIGRPVVSFEVKPQPGEDWRTLLASSKRTFLGAWAMVD